MQMLFEGSEESPDQPGLGVLSGRVVLLPDTVKRPQMQWNPITTSADTPLTRDLVGQWMYFVHSYAVLETNDTLATCEYGTEMVAVAGRDNITATQFHPEKSGHDGLQFLRNFVAAITVPA